MLKKEDLISSLDWKKTNGLIPVVVQHYISGEILMHAYMNKEAVKQTIVKKKVTFFSRKKARLWTKGENSGNFLYLVNIYIDCDKDTILLLVKPKGKTCHLDKISCFIKKEKSIFSFLYYLEKTLTLRKEKFFENSYVSSFYKKKIENIAQKVGEEAVETVIAAIKESKKRMISESSDLIFHLMILLKYRGVSFKKVIQNLQMRAQKCTKK